MNGWKAKSNRLIQFFICSFLSGQKRTKKAAQGRRPLWTPEAPVPTVVIQPDFASVVRREAGQGARDIQGLPVKRGNGARRFHAVVHKRSLLARPGSDRRARSASFPLREKDWGVASNPCVATNIALLLLLFPTKRRVPRSALREPFVIRKPQRIYPPNQQKNRRQMPLTYWHFARGGYQRGCPPLMAFGFFSPQKRNLRIRAPEKSRLSPRFFGKRSNGGVREFPAF